MILWNMICSDAFTRSKYFLLTRKALLNDFKLKDFYKKDINLWCWEIITLVMYEKKYTDHGTYNVQEKEENISNYSDHQRFCNRIHWGNSKNYYLSIFGSCISSRILFFHSRW